MFDGAPNLQTGPIYRKVEGIRKGVGIIEDDQCAGFREILNRACATIAPPKLYHST